MVSCRHQSSHCQYGNKSKISCSLLRQLNTNSTCKSTCSTFIPEIALNVHNHVGLHDPKYCRETLQTSSLFQGGCEKRKITICNENRSAHGDKMQRDFNLTCTSDYNTSLSQDKNSEVITFGSLKSFQLGSQSSAAHQSRCYRQ